ncbi:MAG: 3'-5' exonuclease domain-containing protein 2 [Bacteroidales bacterium]|jgi:ribonuclease D|nr:3'-5' exonuclease domain-containing protein 2 [Bacteroidales bacterium]
MFVSEISNDELHALSLIRFEGKIHVIERPGAAETAVARLRSYPVLGFDTETRPSFTKGKVNHVALLQLSTASEAFLFRLCRMDVPKSLLALLSDPHILKIGAAIKNDIDVLRRSAKIQPCGFIDLQDMVQKFNIKNIGLAKMAGIVLGVRISKSQQLSNWENDILTEAQQRYAATDAWMCYLIYEKLNRSS